MNGKRTRKLRDKNLLGTNQAMRARTDEQQKMTKGEGEKFTQLKQSTLWRWMLRFCTQLSPDSTAAR